MGKAASKTKGQGLGCTCRAGALCKVLGNKVVGQSVAGGAVERIELEKLADGEFLVRVVDGQGESSHRVTLNPEHYNRLTGGQIPQEELVRRSFKFLLKHEPKESILPQFDLQAIGRYFPEYERTIQRAL